MTVRSKSDLDRSVKTQGNLRSAPAAVLFFVVAWFAFVQPARAFDRIYAFGDSLSDTGNIPAPAPDYYNGRFSNGKLWIEYLSPQLGFDYQQTNNYAEEGASTSMALQQVNKLPSTGNLQQLLFVVWAGGIDFVNSATLGFNESGWAEVINGAVNNLSNSVAVLIAKGARTIAVPYALDMTRIPGAALLPSAYKAYAQTKLLGFNTSLSNVLQTLSATHLETRIIPIDLRSRFNDLLDHPQNYGFTKVNIGVLQDTTLMDKSFTGPGKDYLFWDQIHPTTRAHSLVADWFFADVVGALRLSVRLDAGHPFLRLVNLQIGERYQVLATPDFKSWAVLNEFTASAPDLEQAGLDATESYKFFRLFRQN